MTFDPASQVGTSDMRTLMADLSSTGIAETGEVEIAGHLYVTAERLATMLGITVRTLARWNAGRIGPPKISIGKTVLYNVSKLPDWLASRETHLTRKARH
jgi:DNA-binding transcriptional regulator YiaG